MKIKKIAAAALVPAAVAGVSVGGWAAVEAGTSHPGRHPHQAGAVRVTRPLARTVAHRNSPKKVTAAHVASATASHPAHRGAAGPAVARQVVVRHPAVRHTVVRHTVVRHPAPTRPSAVPAPQAAAPSSSSLLSGMSAFEQCVAWRESGDNPTASSAGLFGILPATWASLGLPGTAGQSSVALQKEAFSRLYAQDGTQPWAAYDGC
jgi:hypothetical protein